MIIDTAEYETKPRSESRVRTSLAHELTAGLYPTATSDIAALMVYEHQAHMTNLLARMTWDARAAAFGTDNKTKRDLTEKLLANNARELVDYMLFIDEAAFPGAITPSASFSHNFASQGPRDRSGRSLRQLDLQNRLLRYPCSYMIYSEIFSALPVDAKAAIYKRLWQILSAQDKDAKYNRLSRSDKRAIIEILRDTKSDLPDYFK
jgi:hypothetical protein